MKREICVELDLDLVDRIQVFANPHLSFNEFVEKSLEHIFQCETCDKPDFWGEEL